MVDRAYSVRNADGLTVLDDIFSKEPRDASDDERTSKRIVKARAACNSSKELVESN